MTQKKFHIADILSVTTGVLIRDFDGIYKVMSHLAGRSVFSHELMLFADRAKAEIDNQLQFTSEIKITKNDRKDIPGWLVGIEAKYGSEHTLKPFEE